MPKRKAAGCEDMDGDQTIPLPIQNFFWRQTSPFIRPKLSKLCDASCLSFERVVVQNIHHGLSPSLCEAIQSVSRWKIIQAAFPHVMHACSSLLTTRKYSDPDAKFNTSETKLLYTLHWIILDAASECADADAERAMFMSNSKPNSNMYLHQLSVLQLFVYLFAPLVHTLKDSNFDSLKLENGLRLWQPMWDFRQPDIPCFSTPVKPQRNVLKAQKNLLKVNTNAANIYVGKGSSNDNLFLCVDNLGISHTSLSNESGSAIAPLARMSDICPTTISDSVSAVVEVVCERCNVVMSVRSGDACGCRCTGAAARKDSFVFPFDYPTSEYRKLTSPIDKDYMKQRLVSAMTAGGPTSVEGELIDACTATYFDVAVLRCLFCLHWSEDGVYWALRYIHQRLLEICEEHQLEELSVRERSKSLPIPDIQVSQYPQSPSPAPSTKDSVSIFDDAFEKHGGSMEQVTAAYSDVTPSLESNKEPPYKRFRVSELKQLYDAKKKDSSNCNLDDAESPSLSTVSEETLRNQECMSSGNSGKSGDDLGSSCTISTLGMDLDSDITRPSSAMGNLTSNQNNNDETCLSAKNKDEDLGGNDIARRKSMPSLRQMNTGYVEDGSKHSSIRQSSGSRVDSMPVDLNIRSANHHIHRPIITITEDSPEPPKTDHHPSKPPFKPILKRKDSLGSDKSDSSSGQSANMPRSHTDTNIAYSHEDDLQEVSGSVHYIQNNGHLNYKVILKAAHFVSMNVESARVCEVTLNILNCLLDLDVIETARDQRKISACRGGSDASQGTQQRPHSADSFSPSHSRRSSSMNQSNDRVDDNKSDDKDANSGSSTKKDSAYAITMDTILRVYRNLGCPHGCGDGTRGMYGDHLRLKGQNCFHRLQRINPPAFNHFLRQAVKLRSIQDIVDFMHAYLGFCTDPTNLLVPGASHSPQGHKKSVSQEGLSRNGYHNNFGHSIGGVGYRGVEGVLVANFLKPFVSKCVESWKELVGHENITVFCDVRQLVSYVKEVHGGTFRRVALSGLLDSCLKLKKHHQQERERIVQQQPVRQSPSPVPADSGDEKEAPKSPVTQNPDETTPSGKTRKSLFRRKTKKNLFAYTVAVSDSELNTTEIASTPINSHSNSITPVSSISTTSISTPSMTNGIPAMNHAANGTAVQPGGGAISADDEPTSGPSTPKRRFSKFQIVGMCIGIFAHNLGRKRQTKSDHEEEPLSDPPPSSAVITPPSGGTPSLDRRGSKNEGPFQHRAKGRMSFKAAGQATLTFLSARKRIEDGLKNLGKKMVKRGSIDDFNHRASSDAAGGSGQEAIIIREKRLVDSFLIKSGMLRFSFLLECCHPGTFPDPQLVAAMLDLEAPVVARATMLMEVAHFVHRCNRGDWPTWMRLNLPSFRQSTAILQNRSQPSAFRRNITLQRAAGKMFYSWAEYLGYQLEYILSKEHTDRYSIIVDKKNGQKVVQLDDEEEDFMDEASVNQGGSDCPYALKMLACLVLLEITTFLRESHQYLPKSKTSVKLDPQGSWDRSGTQSSRRWSTAVSSSGQSEKSSESNIAELPQTSAGSPGDRKISFAVLGYVERSDSLHSSTTSLSQADTGDDRKGRRMPQTRQKILKHFRRGSGHNSSFRQNRSFKFKHGQEGGSFKRFGSIKSRKVSSQSLRSEDRSEEEHVEDGDSLGMLSDEAQELSPGTAECAETPMGASFDEPNLSQSFPWVKTVIQLANLSNFICTHEHTCHQHCYERQRRSCGRLITSVQKVYHSTIEDSILLEEKREYEREKRETFREKLKRRESIFQQASPTRRRESTPLLERIKTDVAATKVKLAQSSSIKNEEPKAQRPKEDTLIGRYINAKAQKLTQCPLAILAKAAPILADDHFIDILPVAWELLLETDQELAATASAVFLVSAVKVPEKAQELIIRELQHEEIQQRINAVLRFGTLWRLRYQVWPRMEEGASGFFKVPPPGIDFVLPSPTIGLPMLSVIDPPWTPHFKAKIEEVTVNQEESKSLVTTTTTRRKQQQEMIHKALLAEEERKRIGRETFPMTSICITHQAAYEPALHHGGDEHEEGDEDRAEHSHHMQVAQSFFPSGICATILPLIHLLDDGDVNVDGVSVCEVASKVMWSCITEDPVLFLRHFLEKLTSKDKQEELMFLLRKLLLFFQDLPAQMAHSIFNYMIGYIMFYVRTPTEGGNNAIGAALALLWQAVASVQGIYFKDLKQTLKKEQCDPYMMISANVASAKKIIIHGPDLSSIPSQLPVLEDTQFCMVLQDSLDFFNIPEDKHNCHFLVDTKSSQMHNLNSYVRDFYFFRRNFYPQLSMVHMNPADAAKASQRQAFTLKFVETGKVMFTLAILGSTAPHQIQNHVSFLLEELLKLPAFPRKALEAEFGMYTGDWGKELFSLDTLHKYAWVKLVGTLFETMSDTLTRSQDLPLFMNVVNGTIILHSNDTAVLRYCFGILINASKHFKHIFATNGYMFIMPTILRVYSNNQPNHVLCKAIEFLCKQFYLLHRKPFVLQMFGSIAPILDMACDSTGMMNMTRVQPDCLFTLLCKLEQDCPDNLGVLDLVKDKPLKALDFCYENNASSFTMIDVINMCVTVIAYASDSMRASQMLIILEVVIPRYLSTIKCETNRHDSPSAARLEINQITNTATSMRALISCCEALTRTMSVPQRHLESVNPNIKSMQNHSNHSPRGDSVYYDEHEESYASRYMEEGRKKQYTQTQSAAEDAELRNEYRKPRDALLTIASDFYSTCVPRLRELRRMLADPVFRPPELFDHKTHNRLADVAHTLLKLSPYDPLTMACSGMQKYMADVLPITDWSQEPVRPALNLLLRRLDRSFTKISKKANLRRQLDWDAAAHLLTGVYHALCKFTFIAHLPHLKTLINILISIILSGTGSSFPETGLHGSNRSDHGIAQSPMTPPHIFCTIVIKLAAMQMQVLGDQYCLEYICGGMAVFPSPERCLNMLINFVLPLSIRVGSGKKDTPKLRQVDISFALTLVLNALHRPGKSTGQQNASTKSSHHLSLSDQGRSNSVSHSDKVYIKNAQDLLIQTSFLGLQILIVCFEKTLAAEWHRVAKCIHEIANTMRGGVSLWKFLDFVVSYRPSIFLMLLPTIKFKMMKVACDTTQEYFLQECIKEKLRGANLAHPCCNGSILTQLSIELRQIKEELTSTGVGVYAEYRARTATMGTERSDHSTVFLDNRVRTASMSDPNTDSAHHHKPSLGTIGKRPSKATILSQSSSSTGGGTTPQPPPAANTSPTSPKLQREPSSKRITARDGNRILEKFAKRQSLSEEGAPNIDHTDASPLHQRSMTFRGFKQASTDSMENQVPVAQVLYENEEGGVSIRNKDQYIDDLQNFESRPNRLQRQDAKSRKTFKIKRQKTRTPTVRRFLSRRGRYGTNDDSVELDDEFIPPPRPRTMDNIPTLPALPRPQGGQVKQDAIKQQSIARSVETIPEELKHDPPIPSRPRYIPRSKSHDDPTYDAHAPIGSARGRIARQQQQQGTRALRSRSPSSSPTHKVPGEIGVTNGETYVVRCESQESITTNENSALLKEDDNVKSQASMCIYFDTAEITDTVV